MKRRFRNLTMKSSGQFLILLACILVLSLVPALWSTADEKNNSQMSGPVESTTRGYLVVNLPKVHHFPFVSPLPPAQMPRAIDLPKVNLAKAPYVQILDRSRYSLDNKTQINDQSLERSLKDLFHQDGQLKIVFMSADLNLPYERLVKAVEIAIKAGAHLIGFVGDSRKGVDRAIWIGLMPSVARDVSEHLLAIPRDGRYYYNEETVPRENLKEALGTRRTMKSIRALSLYADRNTLLSPVWDAMQTCYEIEIKRIYLLVDIMPEIK